MTDIVKYIKEDLSPALITRQLNKVNNPLQAINTECKTLALIKKDNDENKVLSIISAWIIDLNEFLNIKNQMSESQIEQTALFILDDYYYFNIAEINLIFTRIKKGFYGSFYESLDGTKLLSYFNQYDIERMGLVDDENYHKHLDRKRNV